MGPHPPYLVQIDLGMEPVAEFRTEGVALGDHPVGRHAPIRRDEEPGPADVLVQRGRPGRQPHCRRLQHRQLVFQRPRLGPHPYPVEAGDGIGTAWHQDQLCPGFGKVPAQEREFTVVADGDAGARTVEIEHLEFVAAIDDFVNQMQYHVEFKVRMLALAEGLGLLAIITIAAVGSAAVGPQGTRARDTTEASASSANSSPRWSSGASS